MQTSRSKQSSSVGLSKTADFVFTLTRRTRLFLSGKTSKILPTGQQFQGHFSALTRTISLTERFLRCLNHFCLICRRGRYSFDHLFQKTLARYCTCLHLRHVRESSFWNMPGGSCGVGFKRSRWFRCQGFWVTWIR